MEIEKHTETVQNPDVCRNMKANGDDSEVNKSVSGNIFLTVCMPYFICGSQRNIKPRAHI